MIAPGLIVAGLAISLSAAGDSQLASVGSGAMLVVMVAWIVREVCRR